MWLICSMFALCVWHGFTVAKPATLKQEVRESKRLNTVAEGRVIVDSLETNTASSSHAGESTLLLSAQVTTVRLDQRTLFSTLMIKHGEVLRRFGGHGVACMAPAGWNPPDVRNHDATTMDNLGEGFYQKNVRSDISK